MELGEKIIQEKNKEKLTNKPDKLDEELEIPNINRKKVQIATNEIKLSKQQIKMKY